MIILQQVYAFLCHSLQMKYLEKKKNKKEETDCPPVNFFATLVETETLLSEAF